MCLMILTAGLWVERFAVNSDSRREKIDSDYMEVSTTRADKRFENHLVLFSFESKSR